MTHLSERLISNRNLKSQIEGLTNENKMRDLQLIGIL